MGVNQDCDAGGIDELATLEVDQDDTEILGTLKCALKLVGNGKVELALKLDDPTVGLKLSFAYLEERHDLEIISPARSSLKVCQKRR